MFTKNTETYVVVPVTRPTFALTPRGLFHRVDHYIVCFRSGIHFRTFFVSDKGVCERSDEPVKIFFSPVSRDEYNHLRSLGSTWNIFTPEYFDQQCKEYGVEVQEVVKENEEKS